MSFKRSRQISSLHLLQPINKPRPPVRTYQPNYRLHPKKRFDYSVVTRIIQRVLTSELEEVEYNDKVIPELTLQLAETIRGAVKEENYDRYRVLVSVTIGQRRQQGLQMFHAFLWDHERDSFASYSYENPHIFANAVVCQLENFTNKCKSIYPSDVMLQNYCLFIPLIVMSTVSALSVLYLYCKNRSERRKGYMDVSTKPS